MTTLGIISGLLAAVIAATIAGKLWPRVPLCFWQVAMGVILWLLPFTFNFLFQPDTFVICVIAPLLFGEAQRVSRKELWELRKPVFLLAFGLVGATVFAGGYFIHALIPVMPLAVAFALAAIISPTDLIAVQSVTKGKLLPGNLTAILEGESLLNDAAGVVSFNVALAAVVTGVFSPGQAFRQFLFTSLGGVAAGLILGYLFVRLRVFLRSSQLEELPMIVVIQLITPLCVFYIAEELGVSGILAVVTAGILHGAERDQLSKSSMKLRMVTDNTWLVLEYLLNGIVFVLLGYLLPSIFTQLNEEDPGRIVSVLLAVAAVTGILLAVRFAWVYFWHGTFVHRKRSRLDQMAAMQMGMPLSGGEREDGGISREKYALIAALCGAHGTFTLATALSVPLMLGSEVFPFRSVILLVACGVVLLSLLLAAVILPHLLEADKEAEGLSAAEANQRILQNAIEVLEGEDAQTAKLVAHYLNQQLAELEQGGRPPQSSSGT